MLADVKLPCSLGRPRQEAEAVAELPGVSGPQHGRDHPRRRCSAAVSQVLRGVYSVFLSVFSVDHRAYCVKLICLELELVSI